MGLLIKRLGLLLALLVAAGLLLFGCGDSGDDGNDASAGQGSANSGSTDGDSEGGENVSGTPANKSIAKKAFIKQGNEICEGTVGKITAQILPPLEELEKEGKTSADDRTALEEELVTTVAVPALRSEVEELQALGSPSGESKKVEAILGSIVKLIEEVEEEPKLLVGTNKAFAKPANLAESYGLKSCPYG